MEIDVLKQSKIPKPSMPFDPLFPISSTPLRFTASYKHYVTDATSMIKYHNKISYVSLYTYLTHHLSSLRHAYNLFLLLLWIQLYLKQRISHLQPYQHQPPLQCPWSQHQQKLPKGHQCQWLAAMPPHQVDPHKMWTDVVSGDVSFLSHWLILKICWPTKSKHQKRRVNTCSGGMRKAAKLSQISDNRQERTRAKMFGAFQRNGNQWAIISIVANRKRVISP